MYATDQQIQDLQNYKEALRRFTRGCRVDMHEPDEQDVSAMVKGKHLDNAMGEDPTSGELVVVLTRGNNKHIINLATLIAMARL